VRAFRLAHLFYLSGGGHDGSEIYAVVSLTTTVIPANRNAERLQSRSAFSPGCNLAVLGHFFHRDRIEERHSCAQFFANNLDGVLGFSITERLELLAT